MRNFILTSMNILGYIIIFGGIIIISLFLIILRNKNLKLEEFLPLILSVLAIVISVFSAFKNEIFPFNITTVAGDNITIISTDAPQKNSPPIILPISFINEGYGSGIIELVTLTIIDEKGTKQIYSLIAEVDFNKMIQK